jgi:hypothetical protein
MKRNHYVLLILLLLFTVPGIAQETPDSAAVAAKEVKKEKKVKDSIPTPYHWNVIKFNPTPMMLWNVNNITFSYERLINKHHSVTFQAGYLVFNELLNDTIAKIFTIASRNKWGMNLSAEYRFYLSKFNRKPAPCGVFLAPYASWYYYNFENGLKRVNLQGDPNVKLDFTLNALNLGASLGYQFVFWKRFTIDFVLFGPSVSFYTAALKSQGALATGDLSDIEQEAIDRLLEKYPQLSTLVSGETLRKSGYKVASSFGFRYSVAFGFSF